MERILFVTPNWHWDDYPLPVDTLLVPPVPPLEWAYLKARLKNKFTVKLIDCYAENLTQSDLAARVVEFCPHITVVSTSPSLLFWRCAPMTVEASRLAVASVRTAGDSRIVLIGPHATHSPGWAKTTTGADAIFRGTPEFGLREFIANPDNGQAGRRQEVDLSLATKLPVADFSVFDWGINYRPHMWSVDDEEIAVLFDGSFPRSVVMEASRGCPWSCAYCAKRPVRDLFAQRSLNDLDAELQQLANLGVNYIFFADETFNHNRRKLGPVLELISGYGFKFGFQGRADLLSYEFAQDLSSAGCIYAELGIDTASDSLSSVISRNQKIEKCEIGVDAAKQQIAITRFNRINLSTVGYKDFFGEEFGHDWNVPADPTYPYPGSPLGDWWSKLQGSNEFDWDKAREFSWWLRLEVYLQRAGANLDVTQVERLQTVFMSSHPKAKSVCASILETFVIDQDFILANKISRGESGDVRDHYSRKE